MDFSPFHLSSVNLIREKQIHLDTLRLPDEINR